MCESLVLTSLLFAFGCPSTPASSMTDVSLVSSSDVSRVFRGQMAGTVSTSFEETAEDGRFPAQSLPLNGLDADSGAVDCIATENHCTL